MPFSGGSADKYGNRYEKRWAVSHLLRVLNEKADFIHYEPPGTDGFGIEYYVQNGRNRTFYQIKRQKGNEGCWTLNDPELKKILVNFRTKLEQDGDAYCTFVSSISCKCLPELLDRAKKFSNVDEFLKSLSDELTSAFEKIVSYWPGISNGDAFLLLKRIDIAVKTEDTLRDDLEGVVSLLVRGDSASNICDFLSSFVEDNLNQKLDASSTWKYLAGKQCAPIDYAKDSHIQLRVATMNQNFMEDLKSKTIVKNTSLERVETKQIMDALCDKQNPQHVLVCGDAGAGKSNVILQICESCEKTNIPFLAIRADHLEGVVSSLAAGLKLGLPSSPAAVLKAMAHEDLGVLIIDQLDAWSLASGRHNESVEVVQQLLRECGLGNKLRVLLVCRKYDLENDPELKRLKQGKVAVISVQQLDSKQVTAILNSIGIKVSDLGKRQMELLSNPLHLKLLVEALEAGAPKKISFETAQDLYRTYWEYKQKQIVKRRGAEVEWVEIMNILADYMSRNQVLRIPNVLVQKYEQDINALVSEHVLSLDQDKNLSFFHEGFFAYSFARMFFEGEKDPYEFVLSGGQDLFRRLQIRQVLIFQREANFAKYLETVNKILASDRVRFHIKKIVLDTLASLESPTSEEWETLNPFFYGEKKYNLLPTAFKWLAEYTVKHLPKSNFFCYARVKLRSYLSRFIGKADIWNVFYKSSGWFELLHKLGKIESMLKSSDEAELDRVFVLLQKSYQKAPDIVADTLLPLIADPKWKNRLLFIMRHPDLSVSRKFFELFLAMMHKGYFDEVNPGRMSMWHVINFLGSNNVLWGCEALGQFLRRSFDRGVAAGLPNPFELGYMPSSSHNEDCFEDFPKEAPETYVESVLSFVIDVIKNDLRGSPSPSQEDEIWSYRSREGGFKTEHLMLSGLEDALQRMGSGKSDKIQGIVALLRANSFDTTDHLLLKIFASNGELFHKEIVPFFKGNPERLAIGYYADEHWTAFEVIKANFAFLSADDRKELENILLNYFDAYELTKDGQRFRGHAQHILLGAIPTQLRSPGILARIQELERKFNRPVPTDLPPVRSRFAHAVGSPLPEHAGEKMSDKQWIDAMRNISQDKVNFKSEDHVVGGVHELANHVQHQAEKEPERFAELALKMPDDISHSYFDSILMAIAKAKLAPDKIIEVCLRCHRLPGHPCGRWLTDAFQKMDLSNTAISSEVLDMISWYATEDENPDNKDESWEKEGQNEYIDAPLQRGINSSRGSAAEAIATIVWHRPEAIQPLLPTLRRMVQDPSIAVRTCVAIALRAMLKHDKDLAVDLFISLCEVEEDKQALWATPPVEDFLHFVVSSHFKKLSSMLEKMMESQVPSAAVVAARQVTLAALDSTEAQPLAKTALSGSEQHRIGAANVFAANMEKAKYLDFCHRNLLRLFYDSSKEVHKKAAWGFFQMEGDELQKHVNLAIRFVPSPAFASECGMFFQGLENSKLVSVRLIVLAAERFLELYGGEATHIAMEKGYDGVVVSKLLLRALNSTKSQRMRSLCLDLIDCYMRTGVHGTGKYPFLKTHC